MNREIQGGVSRNRKSPALYRTYLSFSIYSSMLALTTYMYTLALIQRSSCRRGATAGAAGAAVAATAAANRNGAAPLGVCRMRRVC